MANLTAQAFATADASELVDPDARREAEVIEDEILDILLHLRDGFCTDKDEAVYPAPLEALARLRDLLINVSREARAYFLQRERLERLADRDASNSEQPEGVR